MTYEALLSSVTAEGFPRLAVPSGRFHDLSAGQECANSSTTAADFRECFRRGHSRLDRIQPQLMRVISKRLGGQTHRLGDRLHRDPASAFLRDVFPSHSTSDLLQYV